MNQLKKIGALGGAIALTACWPLAVGQIGQKLVNDGIAQLSGTDYSAEVVSYDRGYFSSIAVTRYSVINSEVKDQLETDGLPTEITVRHNIRHGLTSISTVSVPADMAELPVVLHTNTQLNGNTEFDLVMDTVNRSNDDGSVVVIARSELKGNASILGKVDFTLDIPLVELQFVNGEKISLSELTGSGLGKRENSFWLGKHQFKLKKMAMLKADNTPEFRGTDFSYSSDSSKDKLTGRIDTKHVLEGKKLVSANGVVDSAYLDITLGNLDAKSFEILNQSDSSDRVQMSTSADAFLSKGLYLAMNKMKVSIGDGLIDSHWKLTLPEGIENITQDISKVIPELKGELNTFISNGMITQYPSVHQGVNELLFMEMATETEKGVEIKASVEQGNMVFASGQQVPLLSFLLPVLAQH